MNRIRLLLGITAFLLAVLLGTGLFALVRRAHAAAVQEDRVIAPRKPYSSF
jgi:hypothetical protein